MSAAAHVVNDEIEQQTDSVASKLKAALPNLEDLWTMKQAAQDAWSEAAKAAGEAAGIDTQVVKTFVNAKMRDKLEDFERQSGQMNLLIDELI